MKPTESLIKQIEAIKNLALFWNENMPKKRRIDAVDSSGGVEPLEWDGLKLALSKYVGFLDEYSTLLRNVPPEIEPVVTNKGLSNLLQTFNTLSRACEQRRGRTTTDSPSYYLAEAEGELEGYCSRWLGNSDPYVKLLPPVVFFEKIFGITRSLYAPDIAIVSIPLNLYNNNQEWEALAHEMGHHIFWNALKNYEDLDDLHDRMISTLERLTYREIWENWVEEIFADVCGTLFSGPNYAISSQNIEAEKTRKASDLAQDDGEHPAGYLRPFITIEVLREIEKDNDHEGEISRIEARWNTFVNKSSDLTTEPGNHTLGALDAELPKVINAILNEKIWHGGKTLRQLVKPYRKEVFGEFNARATPDLTPLFTSGQHVAEEKISGHAGSHHAQRERKPISSTSAIEPLVPNIPGPIDENVKGKSMKALWDYFSEKLQTKKRPGVEQWISLMDLTPGEEHDHSGQGGAHSKCRKHTGWAAIVGWHKHADGGSVESC